MKVHRGIISLVFTLAWLGSVGAVQISNVNECDSDPCDSGAHCLDTFGSYMCWCPRGYRQEDAECKTETPHSVELTLLIRNITADDFDDEMVNKFTDLLARTIASENVQSLAFTASVDSVSVTWGLVVTVHTLFASQEEAAAATQSFYHSSVSFRQKCEDELGLRVVHYGRIPTPTAYTAPAGRVATAPDTFEINQVSAHMTKVMDGTNGNNKGLQYVEVTFLPDATFAAPSSADLISSSSVRIGSGASIADAGFFAVCEQFDDAALHMQFDAVLAQDCAPNLSSPSICAFPSAIADPSAPISFIVPVLDGAYNMNDASLFVQFEVSMQHPQSGIVYTLPLGASLSLSSPSPDDESYCTEEAAAAAADTASQTTPAPDGEPEGEASYNADAEILKPKEADSDSESPAGVPTVAMGSGAAAVFLLASGAGVLVVRRRRAQKKDDDDPGREGGGSLWVADLQAQITSDFTLGAAPGRPGEAGEPAGGDVRGVEHLTQRMTRRDMANRLAGNTDDGMVSAVLCCDDGRRGATKARVVGAEAGLYPELVAASLGHGSGAGDLDGPRSVTVDLNGHGGRGKPKRRLSAGSLV